MRVNSGADLQAVQMGGDLAGEVGTATNVTSTSITTNSVVSHTLNDLVGHRVLATTQNPPVEGLVVSNTAGANTVATVDRWVIPGTSTATTTPGNTTVYAILSGGAPARVIALSTDATAPSATDTALTSELSNTGGGLNRAKATYSHVIGATSYALTYTWTANSSDGSSNTVNKVGVFSSSVPVTGKLVFESAVPSPPTLVAGDTIQITETVNI